MVPQKNEGTAHDFVADPIDAYTDGDWVKARGTTLGADNGIGAATALAVLEDGGLEHGPVEALFTVDEEAGMTGARELEAGALKGAAMINLDTEREGEIFIGCAGGVDLWARIFVEFDEWGEDNSMGMVGYSANNPTKPVGYEQDNHSKTVWHAPQNNNYATARLSVTGLKGGHSGMDINLGRGNAIKILARILYKAAAEFDVKLSSLKGGTVRNAIPREAFCEFAIPQINYDDFVRRISELEAAIKAELSVADPDVKISVEKSSGKISRVMTLNSRRRLINALNACQNGVIRMSDSVPGVVETSSNLAIVDVTDRIAEVQCLLRSSVDTARDAAAAMAEAAFKLAGAEVRISGEYPGWNPDPFSRLLAALKKNYRDTFGEEAAVKVVHAGLECGIIAAKYPNMEFASIGPTIEHAHSPDERLHIGSVEKCWKFLTTVLKQGGW
jgi:dipeptidase D